MSLSSAALRICAVLSACIVVLGLHEPPEGVPQFRRDSVESADFLPYRNVIDEEDESFGTRFLPLRDAVESVPETFSPSTRVLSSVRVPLRDAVEQSPIDENTWTFLDEWSGLGKIQSFSDVRGPGLKTNFQEQSQSYIRNEQPQVKNSYYQVNRGHQPHPYRAGSSYQQLVDISQVPTKEELKEFSPGFTRVFQRAPQAEFKVLCYVTNWAFYRKAEGRFVPENLDPELCTHIVYSFSSLDPETLTIKEFDPWADIDNGLYKRITSLDGPEVMLGLGGWTDSAGDKYSRLVSDGGARRRFVASVISFLRRHNFRGLHLDWNYPKCWQSDCRKGPASDKPNFTKLIQELRKEFARESPSLLLGIAISGYKEVIAEAYELSPLSASVDFLSVMSYDYHGAWETVTGHVAPLMERPNDKYTQYNTKYTIDYLVGKGASRVKLLLGVPFYGQSFTLARNSASRPSENAPAAGAGEAGEFTRQPGMLSYYEICHRIRNQRWTVGRVDGSPHATSGDQWVGYEDPQSVMAKADYVVKEGLAGVAAWTADLDDFSNRCCLEAFPLLKALNRALGRLSGSTPRPGDCTAPPAPVTPSPPVLTTAVDSGAPMKPSTEYIHPSQMSSTTWPSWSQKPTEKPTTTTRAPATVPTTTSPWWTTTTRRTTTTAKPVTTTTSWWTTTSRTTTERTTTKAPSQGTTIPAPAVVMPPGGGKPGEKCSGTEYKAHPEDCNAYFRCVLGELRPQYCPGGLHFNRNNGVCDWPSSAKCQMKPQAAPEDAATTTTQRTTRPTRPNRRTTLKPKPTQPSPPKTTTRIPATRMTTTTVRTTKRPDSGCESGQYYEHEECDMFNICVNNVLLSLSCAEGLSWDLETKNCDWAPHVDCATRRSAPLTRVLEENEELLWFRNVPDGTCDGNEYYPYPGDCEKFLLCQWGKLEEADCPPGLHWNQRIGNCDWPTNSQCTEPGPTIVDPDTEEVTPPSSKPSTGKPTTTGTTAAPTPSTTALPLEPLSGHFKVVCYFTNWAWYRKGLGKYLPEHIDPQLCTHVVYGFAVLDYSELTVKAHDSWADFDNKFYARVVALKEKGIKVSLAIGGWNDSAGDKYSRLVNSATARAKFIRHIIAFLEKYDFQGLDLDWEYPVCWQVDCSKGPKSDKEGFAALVKELSDEFRPRGLLLSTAVSPSKTVIDAGYDVPTLAKYFDWIAVMTYDFHGQWDKKTGHVAPLYYHPEDDVSFFNANFSLNYWIEQGAPARKIIMGMPLYGQSFTLSDAKNNGLNAKAPGPGTAGEFTKAAGFLAYYEICDRIKNRGWTVVEDPEGRMGPYAYKGTQWVSYDDVDTIKRKSQLVRALGLGGGMIWALDLDDFRNRCGDGVHPLLTTIREVLRDPPGPQDNLANIPTPSTIVTTTSTTTTRRPYHSGTAAGHMRPVIGNTEIDADRSEDTFKVVCYFTNWAWYRQSGGKYIPSDIDPELCTHVVYGFAVLDGSKLTIKPHDSWADIDNKFYEKVVALIEKGVKVSLAIGGWNDSAGDKYSRLVNSAESRARFIKHVIEFIEKYNFQGLDLDWEYPVCWQVDCGKGPDSDKEGFADLVKELSAEFRPRGLYLSTAVSPSKKVIDAGYDVPKLSKYFDWIAVMTYDYHGQWDKKTGHVAPMYEHPDDFDKTFNANFSINYWIESGADRKKIIMGMPMYGQSFSLADNGRHSLNSPTYGGGEAGDATRARGFLAYYEICNNIRKKGWHVVRDRRGRMGPYAYLRDQWVSFDDVSMIKHKSEFVKAMGLGGAMIWALDLDDFRNTCDCEEYPLLRTINRVLRGYPGQAPKCVLEDKTEIGDNEIIGGSEVSTTVAPVPTTSKRPSRPTKPIDTSGLHPYPPAGVPDTSERPSTVRPTRPAITIGGSIDHTCGGKIFSPHESDCNKYYLCQFGIPQEQRCPAGLHWNKDHCDWPVNTNCENEISGLDVFEKPTRPPRPVVTKPTYVKPTVTSRPVVPVIPTERPKPDETVYVPAEDGKYKVVCYFTNWAWYRPGDGKYTPDDIDADLCTHVVYGFAVLNGDSLTIKAHDSWADFDNKFYERVIALKAKGIKVLLAIGGWNDSAGDKYSRLVNSPSSRSKFITHVTAFLEKYGFDGLDLDWEYPKCWQVECGKGPASDKPSFAKFVKELSDEFRPRGWLLSSAVSPSKMVIDAGYEVPSLARDFDWIAIMAYDFHGHWDKQTGHVAPLYYHPDDTYDYFNANFSINYWIAKGAPPHKLVMGMPLYGQSFSLADSTKRGLNAKSYGPGEAGEFTRAGGFLAFYEICERVRSRGWKVERDSLGRIGPYAHKGTQWVSYDDVEDIRRKSNLVKELGLGGGMIWALDLDDFRGRCGCGKHPLLRTLNQELRGHKRTIYADCT